MIGFDLGVGADYTDWFIVTFGIVRSVKGGFAVFSEKTGKKLSKVFKSKAGAVARLRQIEFFTNKGTKKRKRK